MGDANDAYMRGQNDAVQGRPKVQNRPNVHQLKLIGQSHPTGLTANLLKLFEPRPPLEFKPPPEKRKCPPYAGIAQFVSHFAEPGDPEYAPPVQKGETPAERRARIHKLRLEKGAEKAAEELQKYDPSTDPSISGDPYKTLFVARLSYETTESKIKREFESYGPIKQYTGFFFNSSSGGGVSWDGDRSDLKVRLVTDKSTNKPRGYAFIEYMHTRDMKAAYKQADGRKIDGRRVLVDVERGRTVPNWRPRRLGGGLGTTRVGGEDANQKHSGREVQPSAPPRSEEPRVREDRREREKSRERGRDREKDREKSRERSHERPRDRDHREDRHHRDRDRNRDRDREKEGGRDRDRTRDRDRGRDRGRDRERERDRPRERDRDRDKDHEAGEYEPVESKYDRDRHGKRDRDYDEAGGEDDRGGWYEHKQPGETYEPDQYDRYDQYHHDRYDDMEDTHRYDHGKSELQERGRSRDVEQD